MPQPRGGQGFAVEPTTREVSAQPSVPAALSRIFRFEYLAAAVPGVTITFFMAARSPEQLLSRPPIEGLVVGVLVIFSCLGINSIVDREIDAQYLTDKSRIASGVGVVRPARVWAIIAAMNVVALVLTVDLCVQFQSWIPLALMLAQVLCAYGYSIPPLQFKLRGVLAHAFSLALATCFIPFVLSVYTFLGTVPASLAAFLVGFAVLQYGLEFSNQALDYVEDKAAGLRTPAVRLGVEQSLRVSLIVMPTGMTILLGALLVMYFERSWESSPASPSWVVLSAFGLSVIVLIGGYLLPVVRTGQMFALCRDRPPVECVPKLPRLCNYARWQASSVLGIAATTGVFFVITNYLWR